MLAQGAIDAEQARKDSGLDHATFPLFWELKRHVETDPQALAVTLNGAFVRFPNFGSNAEELRQLKAEIYKILLPVVQGKKMVELAERLLRVRKR